MKKAFSILAFVFLLYAPLAHAGGIPVIDSAALAQDASNFAKELQEMIRQYENMQAQLAKAKEHFEAVTGDRGMGQLLDGQIKNYIPDEWKSALAILDQPSGYSGLSSNIQEIIDENKVLSDSELNKLSPAARQVVEEERKAMAAHKALGEASYKNASERFQALQTLTNAIGMATDPKAIMDLQARIQTEQNALTNETNKLNALAETLRSEEIIRQQKKREVLSKSGGSVRR